MTHVYIEAETYTVSVLPPSHPYRTDFELVLENWGGRWAVRKPTGRWFDRHGGSEWFGTRLPEGVDENRYLMSLTEARNVAVKVAPTLSVNGGPSAQEVLEEQQ